MKTGTCALWMTGIAAVCWLTAGQANAEDTVILTNGKELQIRSIQWRESEKAYRVETTDGVVMPLPKAQVQEISLQKPADYDKASALIASKQYAAAVPLLEDIILKYKMLNWDNQARVLLAQAYLGQGVPKKAADTLSDYMNSVPKSDVPDELNRVYWTALLQAGMTATLKKELDAVATDGARSTVAAAVLMRGNMNREAGQKEAALLDYLRVIVVCGDVKEVQPEALYKAADVMEEIRDPRKDGLRKKLIQEYGNSEYAAKLKGKL